MMMMTKHTNSNMDHTVNNESTTTRTIHPIQKVLSAAFLATTLLFSQPTDSGASNYNALTDEQKVVAEAWRLVDNSYLDRTFNGVDWFGLREQAVKKKYKNMAEAQSSIQGLIAQLGDKYTRYLPPGTYQSLVDAATGTLAGVGVEITIDKTTGQLTASEVQPNSPAEEAGVKAGDVFRTVDGTDFDQFSTPDDVALKVRGPAGSKVGLVMERNGEKVDFILTRQPLKITTVFSYATNVNGVGKVGVIRLKNFSGTTAETVKTELAALEKQKVNAYVFDLRGNPGGLLPGGTDTAALFLSENAPLVYVVNKSGVVDAQEHPKKA